jgi:hypothetical protein
MPGVKIVGPMNVCAHPDAPHGHMHIIFIYDNVRVPKQNMLPAKAAASRSLTAKGMVRPCSGPASTRSWQGPLKTRSTPCLRN